MRARTYKRGDTIPLPDGTVVTVIDVDTKRGRVRLGFPDDADVRREPNSENEVDDDEGERHDTCE